MQSLQLKYEKILKEMKIKKENLDQSIREIENHFLKKKN
jgi:uncharacterized membrane-anchored protein YhcB (DUF1043 family)